jgi:hypothetical protein
VHLDAETLDPMRLDANALDETKEYLPYSRYNDRYRRHRASTPDSYDPDAYDPSVTQEWIRLEQKEVSQGSKHVGSLLDKTWCRNHYGEAWYALRKVMIKERALEDVHDPLYSYRQNLLRVLEHNVDGRPFRPSAGLRHQAWVQLWTRLSKGIPPAYRDKRRQFTNIFRAERELDMLRAEHEDEECRLLAGRVKSKGFCCVAELGDSDSPEDDSSEDDPPEFVRKGQKSRPHEPQQPTSGNEPSPQATEAQHATRNAMVQTVTSAIRDSILKSRPDSTKGGGAAIHLGFWTRPDPKMARRDTNMQQRNDGKSATQNRTSLSIRTRPGVSRIASETDAQGAMQHQTTLAIRSRTGAKDAQSKPAAEGQGEDDPSMRAPTAKKRKVDRGAWDGLAASAARMSPFHRKFQEGEWPYGWRCTCHCVRH